MCVGSPVQAGARGGSVGHVAQSPKAVLSALTPAPTCSQPLPTDPSPWGSSFPSRHQVLVDFSGASSPSFFSVPTTLTSGSPPTDRSAPPSSASLHVFGVHPASSRVLPTSRIHCSVLPSPGLPGPTSLAHPHLTRPHLAQPPRPAAPQASPGRYPWSPFCTKQGSPLTCRPLFLSTLASGASHLLGAVPSLCVPGSQAVVPCPLPTPPATYPVPAL